MALTSETKQEVQKRIFERAYEIEDKLSEDNFFLAKMAGLKPNQVSAISLRCAVKELKKELA